MGQITHILTRNMVFLYYHVYFLPKTPSAFAHKTPFAGFTIAWNVLLLANLSIVPFSYYFHEK